jgi:SPP1 family predicted phage head-tail adaptor
MDSRIQLIKRTDTIVSGRKVEQKEEWYTCWAKVQSLNTREKYESLQIGLENTIVFKVRACKRVEEVRLNLKKYRCSYKGTELRIYDASPMITTPEWVLLKCCTVE